MANDTQRFAADAALRAGVAGMTGGVGAGLRRATEAAAEHAVDRTAQKLGQRLSRSIGAPLKRKKMTGLFFYGVLSLTALKDVTDILADFTVLLSLITPLTTVFVSLTVATYLYIERITISNNKIAVYLIALIFEFIPVLNMIPTTSIALLLTKWLENASGGIAGKLKKAGAIAKKI